MVVNSQLVIFLTTLFFNLFVIVCIHSLLIQGMMTCPVCFGAFSWRDDLLHHFGAVHHLEELILHLESEFACDTCPPCCRVPPSLFESLFQEPSSCLPSPARSTDSAQSMQEKQHVTTKHLHTDLPVKKVHRADGTQTEEDRTSRKVVNSSSPRHKSRDISIKSIERYHCELCDFSANDIRELEEHGSEHQSGKVPVPPSPDDISTSLVDNYCTSSPRKQVQDRYFCDSCPFSAKCQQHIISHMKSHQRSALVKVGYKCAYCNMASVGRGSIHIHQTACHRGRPIRILRIEGGKVVKDSTNCDAVAKPVTPKSSLSSSPSSRKQRKLKLSESNLIADGSSSRASPKSMSNKRAASTSSLNAEELLSSEKEELTKVLESQLPEQMIYRKRVCCPMCDFDSLARVNLVRHIRMTHGRVQQSQARFLKCCPASVFGTSCANVDATSLSLV